jgi:serine/threonine protein kinase
MGDQSESRMAGEHAELMKRAGRRLGMTLLGKWTLDRLIDVGGMGAVYGATHRNGKQVAIKILHPEFATDGETRTRFLREGYVANKIGHPGAVSVLDDDTTEDGSVFLVMELLEGESLEGRIAKNGNRLDPASLLTIIDAVLDVLAAAHGQGIVHRDIKPANLFITRDGEAKILDFGLAHVRERSFNQRLTRTGMVMGTSTYMPPEQARAQWKMVDARSDIWAVGATMFRALAGRHVHHNATTQIERMLAAMSQHAPPLASVAPSVPAGVALLVDRALAFQRRDRWADARAMQKALRYAYRGLEKLGAPPLASAALIDDDSEQPAVSVRLDDSYLDRSVNVVVDTSESNGDSIVVEISDEQGTPQTYQLEKAGPAASEDLMEVTAVSTVIERPKGAAG